MTSSLGNRSFHSFFQQSTFLSNFLSVSLSNSLLEALCFSLTCLLWLSQHVTSENGPLMGRERRNYCYSLDTVEVHKLHCAARLDSKIILVLVTLSERAIVRFRLRLLFRHLLVYFDSLATSIVFVIVIIRFIAAAGLASIAVVIPTTVGCVSTATTRGPLEPGRASTAVPDRIMWRRSMLLPR